MTRVRAHGARRPDAMACGAAALLAVAWLACLGKPSPPLPPPGPSDSFDLGDGKLLVTCRQDDHVAFLDPTALAGGDRSKVLSRFLYVGFDPFTNAFPHEALVGPNVFGDGQLSWFVTTQSGPRTFASPAPVPDGGLQCDVTANPHCAHQGGSVPGAVERYRVSDNAFLGRAEAGYGAAQMAIMPDGSKMFVTAFDTTFNKCGQVTILNPRTMTVVRTLKNLPRGPHGLALSPDGKTLVVATTWDRIVVIPTDDTNDGGAEMRQFTELLAGTPAAGDPPLIGRCDDTTRDVSPRYLPNTVAMAPDGGRAYVSIAGSPSSVVAVDLATQTLVPDFHPRTEHSPQQVAVTPDGKTLVVPCSGDNTLAVIDLNAQTHKSVLLGYAPFSTSGAFGVTVSPDGKTAWVAVSCYEWIGNTCQNLKQGGVVAVDLTQAPNGFLSKVPVCDGVTHVTFGRNPQ